MDQRAYPAGEASGYKGGTFALVGPGWQGDLPANAKRIDCPTRWIELQPRIFVKDQADLAAAEEVLRAITVKGLSEYRGGPVPHPLPTSTKRRKSRRTSRAANCSSTIRCSSGRSSPRR